jgi:hypothetical protein
MDDGPSFLGNAEFEHVGGFHIVGFKVVKAKASMIEDWIDVLFLK